MMIVIERIEMSSLIRHYSIVKQFDRHSSSRTFFFAFFVTENVQTETLQSVHS